MNLFRGLPAPVRELLSLLSPRALQVVDLAAMTGALPLLGRQWLLGTGVAAAQAALALTQPPGVVFGKVPAPLAVESLSRKQRKQCGEKVLSIYFRQLFGDAPLFFDLRPAHLFWVDNTLIWEPTKAFYALDPSFRWSLQNLYRGYYGDDLPLLKRALRELKLVPDGVGAATESRVIALLLHEFSGGKDDSVRFSLQHFRKSFDALFELVLEGGNRLPADFAFIGLLLASLHMTLEALDVELEVYPQFLAAISQAKVIA